MIHIRIFVSTSETYIPCPGFIHVINFGCERLKNLVKTGASVLRLYGANLSTNNFRSRLDPYTSESDKNTILMYVYNIHVSACRNSIDSLGMI